MPSREGQTFELPKRASMNADLFTTQEQRDDAKREKVLCPFSRKPNEKEAKKHEKNKGKRKEELLRR